MSARLVAVTFDADDPERLAPFWGALLDREPVADRGGAFLPAYDGQVGLRFAPGGGERDGPGRMHLHLTSDDDAHQRRTVETALSLGAHHLDVGQRPEEGHVVLADPEGNELCVLGPGSSFLAGCGFLGEVAGDGERDTGVFWSAALGWPLVWDQDGETAVQSPEGGTKVAWGGPPVAPQRGTRRQRFELATDGDRDGEVERLLALGATRVTAGPRGDGAVVLADPAGTELLVRAP